MSANHLHLLIKSLSAPEKGYIKKQALLHVIGSENKYIKIFDAIDKQKVYDEKEIIRKFKGEPTNNNFAVAKNYLFKFILKSLESYNNNVKSELRSSLNQIEILYNKNLPIVAKKMILKSKAIALEHELYEVMEEFIDWEIILLVEEATPENYLKLVNKYFEELYGTIEKKKIIIGYKHLYQKLRAKALYTGLARNDEDVLEFQKIANEAKRNDKNLLNTFNAQYYRNLMQANFLFTINEQEQANEILKKNVDLLDQNKHMLELKPFTYIGLLRNKAVNELSLMLYSDLFKTLERMDRFVKQYGQLNRNFELLTENLKLFVYIPTGEFNKALEIAKKLEKIYALLPQTKSLQKEKQLHHYALAYIYIGLGEYKLANQNINLLLHNTDLDFRSDLFCFAHILSLIIYFELDDQDMMEKRIRSTYRLLLKRNKLYQFEKQIISFFKNTQGKDRPSLSLTNDFVKLKNNIEELTTNKVEKNALNLFDLISWLESKIEKKSFMSIKQQKFNKLMSNEASNAHMH
ncbi:MAG: hypothetical protein NTX97_12300 [Bacteroidetes bacterium]|nr:hypothetical protein [Bacteroidota bacterium]